MDKEKAEKLKPVRHSCEHVLHLAMTDLFPGLKRAMGPATNEGFYFDFDYDGKIKEADFPKIEKRMQEIINADLPIVKEEISIEKAKEMFKNNPYKLEWVDEIEKKGEKATIYWTGEPNKPGSDPDLCKGPHIESTGKIGPFKLLSVAGAYWHGDEKNKMLTRIYGTCFETKEELDKYLWQIEESKKRDHRRLGEQLDIFTISEEVGPGLILWLPKGTIIKEELEKFAKETERNWGYKRVATPHITKSGLYYTSGHLPYYKDDMYPPMVVDKKEEYYLKPMNCPHHHMIYKSKPKSYKELPLRLTEFGTCYRYEASGELYGMMRVRGFTQNDAHIYCTLSQAVDEFVDVMKLHEHYYKIFGIKEYHLELGLRDPKKKNKYHGDEKMWEQAEDLMRKAIKKTNIKMVEQEGSAAFYGPKVDFVIHTVTGKEYAISTNQIDLYMGKRFDLKYIDDQGKEKTPAIIHRAPLGSDERFIGFLIEHYAGVFPTWLSPVQVEVVPVSDKVEEYAKKVYNAFSQENIRVGLNNKNETLGAKIREATLQKVPFLCIIGEKEKQMSQEKGNLIVSVRTRDGKNLGQPRFDRGQIEINKFLEDLKTEIEKKI
ncbi:threonine--tRNA ligase [Candidatus Parcubacteria bacterium]|nr:MAG: threonine--tRNA ligase [Candidatus Parcubacteria bacterium]